MEWSAGVGQVKLSLCLGGGGFVVDLLGYGKGFKQVLPGKA